MLDKLIQEGKALEATAVASMVGKYFNTVEFEKWSTKVVVFFENNHSDSVVTNKLKAQYEKLNSNNNYNFYLFAQGVLEATQENV
jgi:hypothetical protein